MRYVVSLVCVYIYYSRKKVFDKSGRRYPYHMVEYLGHLTYTTNAR